MHSLSKMAAINYFPSIHDKTTKNIWTSFDPKPKRLHLLTTSSATKSSNMTFNAGAGQNSSTAQQAEGRAPWTTSGRLAVIDYQPLDVFGGTTEDPGSASWSEAEELCEVLIRLKEIELCNMIGETSGIPECK